jgi:DNA modification methylase
MKAGDLVQRVCFPDEEEDSGSFRRELWKDPALVVRGKYEGSVVTQDNRGQLVTVIKAVIDVMLNGRVIQKIPIEDFERYEGSPPEIRQANIESVNLMNQDCLSYLPALPDESIDLVVTDPPYYKIVSDKWDHQWKLESEYLTWCRQWTQECVRVLKPGGCLYVWGTTKTDTFLRYKLDVLNLIPELVYQNWIIWAYDWGGRTKKKFPRKHEDLLMYSKGKTFRFNDYDIRVPYKMEKNVRAGKENNPRGKIPTDVWTMNNHTTSKEYCGWHPTQKPIRLLERVIKAHTNPGDAVLDVFSGSGSTAVACINLDRQFFGCELNQTYYQKSLLRIQELTGVKGL